MLHKIRLQTPEGIREYKFVPDSITFDQAKESGEITVGEEIIYRELLVCILENFSMLAINRIQQIDVPPFAGDSPPFGNVRWEFTMNGVPVNPEVVMNGGNKAT